MKNHRLRRFNLKIIQIFVLVTGFWLLVSGLSFAAVPHLINYQGRLTDKTGKPLEGYHELIFGIYDKDAKLLWEEKYLKEADKDNRVLVQKGVFSVLLGSRTKLDLAFDQQYYLQITVDGETMTDKQMITSSGYAIRAEKVEKALDAEKLNNQPPSYYLDHGNLSGLSDNDHPQYVKGKYSSERIEKGTFNVSNSSSASVSFDNPFSNTPIVVCTVYYNGEMRPHYQIYLTAVSAAGFTVKNDNDCVETIYWIAIGS